MRKLIVLTVLMILSAPTHARTGDFSSENSVRSPTDEHVGNSGNRNSDAMRDPAAVDRVTRPIRDFYDRNCGSINGAIGAGAGWYGGGAGAVIGGAIGGASCGK
jgi:hypothetical protein